MGKRITAGILAHVDAGKTTLSEALLYRSGRIRSLGRVDHGDAFLDTDTMERQRGITIFAHQTTVTHNDLTMTLLDTPGHVDFSAETERVIDVLDYAILVVSAADGVQGHTETLWRLLDRYHVPTFVFVNKMDSPGADRNAVFGELRGRLSDSCVDFTAAGSDGDGIDDAERLADPSAYDDIAMCSEDAMDDYLETGRIDPALIRSLITQRKVFPCLFGSALRLDGVDGLLDALAVWTEQPRWRDGFGARVFKISHDERHNRLTWLKVTGGGLKAKAVLPIEADDDADDAGHDKIDQIRVYDGSKYEVVTEVPAGAVCAVTGPTRTFPGEGLGSESGEVRPVLQPVLTYTLEPAGDRRGTGDESPAARPRFDDLTLHRCLTALRELEDEDPLLHVVWVERLQEIHVQLMGAVQLEIIEQVMHDRFGLDVSFGPGGILYRETITAPVEGVGHFEPLRHYAEAHILLEPTGRGTGMSYATSCSLDVLDRNWQRLILTHLKEKEHLGVLTGSPITDMRLTLLTGRAHEKHTEGGDFRQATYRAVRQGLMEAKERGLCRVLEPWYRFRLEVPQDMVGRAMADVQRMGGTFDPPDTNGDDATLHGECPVSEMRDYAMDVNTYTHGRGRLACTFAGYRPCHDEERVVEEASYDPCADLDNTPDSVFCSHGAGYPVAWNDVPDHMHLPYAHVE